jgi:hypothetical protein
MREKVHTDDGVCGVSHHEQPREIPVYIQVQAGRQSSVGVDGSAISRIGFVVDAFLPSRN